MDRDLQGGAGRQSVQRVAGGPRHVARPQRPAGRPVRHLNEVVVGPRPLRRRLPRHLRALPPGKLGGEAAHGLRRLLRQRGLLGGWDCVIDALALAVLIRDREGLDDEAVGQALAEGVDDGGGVAVGDGVGVAEGPAAVLGVDLFVCVDGLDGMNQSWFTQVSDRIGEYSEERGGVERSKSVSHRLLRDAAAPSPAHLRDVDDVDVDPAGRRLPRQHDGAVADGLGAQVLRLLGRQRALGGGVAEGVVGLAVSILLRGGLRF